MDPIRAHLEMDYRGSDDAYAVGMLPSCASMGGGMRYDLLPNLCRGRGAVDMMARSESAQVRHPSSLITSRGAGYDRDERGHRLRITSGDK